MAWFDGICESIGQAMIGAGEECLGAGLDVWKQCSDMVIRYCTSDPTKMGAWDTVKGLYDTFMGIGVSLMVLFFVIGWLRESIDIRNNFTLENMFRFFLRLTLTAALLSNGLSLIKDVMKLSALLAGEIGMQITTEYTAAGIFSSLTEGISGGDYIRVGILCVLGGFLGMMVIIASGISILMSVLTRFFKIFLCIPFAPAALSSFAGGGGLSNSGTAWIKTFFGYCLEAVVIALTLVIAFKLFNGKTVFHAQEGWSRAVLGICEICLPLVTAVGCVKGAEGIVRKTLGL